MQREADDDISGEQARMLRLDLTSAQMKIDMQMMSKLSVSMAVGMGTRSERGGRGMGPAVVVAQRRIECRVVK